MAQSETYGSGTVPKIGDTKRMLLVKLVIATNAGGGSSGLGSVYATATDPTGVLSVTGPGYAIGKGASDGLYWKKTSAGTGTDWVGV
jgi:hypothetical protein